MERRFLSTRQVARLLDVNDKMVYTLVAEKGLPATKVTGKWRFPLDLVERWLDESIINSPEPGAPGQAPGLVVVAGSNDILLDRAIALFNRVYPEHLAVFGNVGSLGGIRALARGACHVAASHLIHKDEAGYNFDFAAAEFGGRVPAVLNFSMREQGLVVAHGNPLGIRSVAGLGKPGVTVVNRPEGTGTRLLFDRELARAGLDGADIPGYGNEVKTHLEAGLEVLSGRASAACAIRPVAQALGLGFVPLRWERFDLLIAKERFFDPGVQGFLGLLHDDRFAALAVNLEGYDIQRCGRMVYPADATAKDADDG